MHITQTVLSKRRALDTQKRLVREAVAFVLVFLTGSNTAQVVCTLGPVSRTVEMLEELLRAGMSVARFNFSHGTHDYHQVRARGLAFPTGPCLQVLRAASVRRCA